MPPTEKSVQPSPTTTSNPVSACPVTRATAFAGRLAAKTDLQGKPVWWLAAAVLLIVALCETAVMLMLALFPPLPAWQEAAVDVLLLSLLAAPALWFVTRSVARRLDSAERNRLAARMGAILTATVNGEIVTDGAGETPRGHVVNREKQAEYLPFFR